MALYYYKKYTISYYYTYDNPHYVGISDVNDVGNAWYLYADDEGPDIDYYDGYDYASNPRGTTFGFLNTSNSYRWVINSAHQVYSYIIWGGGYGDQTVYEQHATFELDRTLREEDGSYISTIIAEDGTYPDNGSQGGYWYKKQDEVSSASYVKVGGTWQLADAVYIKVSGTWQLVDMTYIKVSGTWEQSS